MSVAIHADLPDDLVAAARRFIDDGRAEGLDALLAEALRRYLDSHTAALSDVFIREDVEWGLHGRD